MCEIGIITPPASTPTTPPTTTAPIITHVIIGGTPVFAGEGVTQPASATSACSSSSSQSSSNPSTASKTAVGTDTSSIDKGIIAAELMAADGLGSYLCFAERKEDWLLRCAWCNQLILDYTTACFGQTPNQKHYATCSLEHRKRVHAATSHADPMFLDSAHVVPEDLLHKYVEYRLKVRKPYEAYYTSFWHQQQNLAQFYKEYTINGECPSTWTMAKNIVECLLRLLPVDLTAQFKLPELPEMKKIDSFGSFAKYMTEKGKLQCGWCMAPIIDHKPFLAFIETPGSAVCDSVWVCSKSHEILLHRAVHDDMKLPKERIMDSKYAMYYHKQYTDAAEEFQLYTATLLRVQNDFEYWCELSSVESPTSWRLSMALGKKFMEQLKQVSADMVAHLSASSSK